jgi:hypothetical protein
MSACPRPVVDPVTGGAYCRTSMASAHAVGVVTLILSARGDLGTGRVQQATTHLSCPDTSIYAPFLQLRGEPQTCQGDAAHTSECSPLWGSRRPQGRAVDARKAGPARAGWPPVFVSRIRRALAARAGGV